MYVKVHKVYCSILKCLNKMATSKNKNLLLGDKKVPLVCCLVSCLVVDDRIGN